MSRLGGSLSDNHHRVLSQSQLSTWSADDFAFARDLARSPVRFTGGFANAQVRLCLFAEGSCTGAVQAVVPIQCRGEALALHVCAQACDGLASLLERGPVVPGCGATLSLDALEALVAGLLAPLDAVTLGEARWAAREDSTGFLAALHFEQALIALEGSRNALMAVRDAMAAKSDRFVAAPLAKLRDVDEPRFAVAVERLLGAVRLSEQERASIEIGSGILLDGYWPDGRGVVAGRFATHGDGGASEAGLEGALLVRSAVAMVPLEADALEAPAANGQALELTEGQSICATGHLAVILHEGMHRPVFVVDDLPAR